MDQRALAAAISDAVIPVIAEALAAALSPVYERIKALEDRKPDAGKPGKDADPDQMRSAFEAIVAAALPAVVGPAVNSAVTEAVSAIPAPKDGKDADPQKMVEEIQRIVAELPPASPGKDADPVDPADLMRAAAAAMTELIPLAAAQAVTTVREELVTAQQEIIDRLVEARVAKIEIPEPKLPDPEDVQRLVETSVDKAIAEIRIPEDGKSITVDEIRPVLDELVAERVAALPPAAPGKDADPVDMDAVRSILIEEVTKAIPVIEPAKDGKDADMDALSALVVSEVERRFAEVRIPQDGKSVSIDEVRPVLSELVKQAVSEIEPPKDGKDADPVVVAGMIESAVERRFGEIQPPAPLTPEDVRPVIEEVVKTAVAALPPAEPGKDADPVDPEMVRDMVKLTVSDALATIDLPKDGKSVTLDEVLPEIRKAVAEEYAANPPAAGRDADPVDPSALGDMIKSIVEERVSELPPAQPGRDADPVDMEVVSRQITSEVERIVSALPPAKDGTSVSVNDVQPLIAEEVQKAVAALPPAVPGKDADPVDMDAVKEIVKAEVTTAVAAIEIPAAPTVDDVMPEIVKAISAKIAELPPVENGKDADPEVIKSMIIDAVAALPPAAPGKDADPIDMDAVAKAIDVAVASTLETWPKPKDGEPGKSVDMAEVAQLVAARVQDGVNAHFPASMIVDAEGMLVGVYASGDRKEYGKVRGADGQRGASMMDGALDEDGTLTVRMSDGRNINLGNFRGPPGKDAKPGEPGKPGRDAVEIQIAAGVDESRGYSPGVYALWRGGVIKSDRHTDPIEDGDILKAGWKVVLEGIAEETENSLDDGRTIERTTIYTSGREWRREIKSAVPIDRGVWKEKEYVRGDGVTFGGSWFIAQRDTTPAERPGDKSGAWRLTVKRGRDGQDGVVVAEKKPSAVTVPGAATKPDGKR